MNRSEKRTKVVIRIFIMFLIFVGCKSDRENNLIQNKELILRMNDEVWNKGNLEIMDEIYTSNFIWHFLPRDSETTGLDSLKMHVQIHREAFPDWTEEIKHIVVEEDFVAIHYLSKGTNKGSFQGNPPTGKPVKINEMAIFRIENGKIAEQWLIPDLLSLNQQLNSISQSN